jgi:hypothetical protein
MRKSSFSPSPGSLHAAGEWQPLMRQLGLDADAVFTHPEVRAWRTLPDRQNCTIDAQRDDGTRVRLHVKRYASTARAVTPAEEELAGHQLLLDAGIPTATLVAWGVLRDSRSFVIFEDLAGYVPADKLLERGFAFDRLLRPTACLAAKLHDCGLHHRDLYLCHFLLDPASLQDAGDSGDRISVRLIDAARVRRMSGFLSRGRWVVKDLAQFWYSTLRLPITDAQRDAWLHIYAEERQLPGPALLRGKIDRKVHRIARHDARLNRVRPTRNVSIPW